ncbi:MAG: carboxypeptidase regulatory-like domain-containing protein [Planctomycetes bacterium]|nr:carboxypeptidase regulatory-like domain-containing protein [Planctomycetota bacterium]
MPEHDYHLDVTVDRVKDWVGPGLPSMTVGGDEFFYYLTFAYINTIAFTTAQVSFTIGGAIYEDPSSPLTSGLEGVTVAVSGANGTYAGTTSSGTGLWQIAAVNVGDYTVTPSKPGWSFEHIVAGVPDGKASITITVNEANLAANQSIQFLAERSVLHDWNGDGIVSIIGDVPPFVNCVYFQSCPDVPGNQLLSIGDCNGDGILSIIGDVPCFVECVYFGNCPE